MIWAYNIFLFRGQTILINNAFNQKTVSSLYVINKISKNQIKIFKKFSKTEN